jgi:hypothetical protein
MSYQKNFWIYRSIFNVVVLLTVSVCNTYGQDTPLCQVQNLATDVSKESGSLEIVGQMFSSGLGSAAVAKVRNVSDKPVIAIQFAIEYFDAGQNRLGSIAFQAATKGNIQTLVVLRPGSFKLLPDPIEPGQIFSIGGIGSFSTSRCPVRANLTYVFLRFADQKIFEWFSPTSLLDAFPKRFMLSVIPSCLSGIDEAQVMLQIQIDEAGSVRVMSTLDSSNADLQQCIGSKLEGSTFYPALREGKPVSSEIAVLFRIHKLVYHSGVLFDSPSPREVSRPSAILDLIPNSVHIDTWLTGWSGVLVD